MIDQSFIQTISGKGGKGCISGRREKFVPRGGPDGGTGGNGGSVFLHSSTDLNTLRAFRYRQRFVAERGGDGAGGLKHGKKGSDLVIEVPVGTEVWTLGPNPVLLVDLRNPSQRVRVAKGGRGGRGNASFVTSTNRFPLLAEEGEAGELAFHGRLLDEDGPPRMRICPLRAWKQS